MSQWAEIRQMHVVDGVPKKQIAERLGLDIKTVRRAVAQATAPARRAVSRPRHLDRWRAQIEQWLRQDRRLTAKRIRRLLLPLAGPVAERAVRWYVARLKAAAAPKEVYVHRSPRPGVTLEVDFGESWAEVAGVLRKVKYVVATLPYSNVYFAKAYPIATGRRRPAGGCGPAPTSGIQPSGMHPQPGPGRARVRRRRPAPAPRVPRSRAASYLWPVRPYAVPRRTRRRGDAVRGAAGPAGWGHRRAGVACACCAR